jgi:ATP-dependent RNA helicase DDX46/PRP5
VLENEDEKLYKLIMIIQEWYDKGSILIFVEKQVQVDELFKELWNVGYKSLVLHGGMD